MGVLHLAVFGGYCSNCRGADRCDPTSIQKCFDKSRFAVVHDHDAAGDRHALFAVIRISCNPFQSRYIVIPAHISRHGIDVSIRSRVDMDLHRQLAGPLSELAHHTFHDVDHIHVWYLQRQNVFLRKEFQLCFLHSSFLQSSKRS